MAAHPPNDPLQTPPALAALIESAPVAVVVVDRNGTIALVNAETERLLGYERGEILGRAVDMLVPERFRTLHPTYREAYLRAPQERSMGLGRDLYALRKDGSEVPVEIGLNPIRAGAHVYVMSAIVDLSERKRMEARTRAMIESAPTAMVMIDRAGRIVLANAEAERLFAYERDELVGNNVELLVPERFRPDHPRLREGFLAAPAARGMGVGRDLFARRKDGSEFPVEIGLNPVETDEGLFVLSAIVDLTERKRLEAAQRELNRELKRHVTDLARSNEALERSNVELQEFAYVASHDLQTPLRGIAGFAQCLQEDYAQTLDQTGAQYIDRIVGGAKRMHHLIRDVLEYSRVESRARPFQAVDLDSALAEALALLEASIAETGARITHDPLPVANGDPSQLSQVLLNLIGNAIKYQGASPPEIHISARANGDEWVVSVRDNGIGIDPRQHERIFGVFQRLHTPDRYPGNGIGLSVCRRIIHRHGGGIRVESTPGTGSVFSFTLPRTPEGEHA